MSNALAKHTVYKFQLMRIILYAIYTQLINKHMCSEIYIQQWSPIKVVNKVSQSLEHFKASHKCMHICACCTAKTISNQDEYVTIHMRDFTYCVYNSFIYCHWNLYTWSYYIKEKSKMCRVFFIQILTDASKALRVR